MERAVRAVFSGLPPFLQQEDPSSFDLLSSLSTGPCRTFGWYLQYLLPDAYDLRQSWAHLIRGTHCPVLLSPFVVTP